MVFWDPSLPCLFHGQFSLIIILILNGFYLNMCKQQDASVLNTMQSMRRFSSVQFIHSVGSNSLWPHGLQHTRPPCAPDSQSLPKLMPIELVMSSNHLILYCPLLFLPSIFPSIRVFSNESVLPISWPQYWSFSFNISPSNEHSGLISFRMDWLDLLADQGALKSLFQHHGSKASILWHSAFLMV